MTLLVAHWLDTTEARLNPLLDFTCVVVLEGTAGFARYLAGIRPVAPGRTAVASDRMTTMPQHEAVVPILEATSGSRGEQTVGHAASIADRESVAGEAGGRSAM
ncbi:hypothetical protein PQQ96_38315 [Paraburkholderia sediminicola]|uniref:hypothetical protein n=1 Tax=Paraburkholderia sediminicola TaxID=458836 RepID=UPI0038BB1E4F